MIDMSTYKLVILEIRYDLLCKLLCTLLEGCYTVRLCLLKLGFNALHVTLNPEVNKADIHGLSPWLTLR